MLRKLQLFFTAAAGAGVALTISSSALAAQLHYDPFLIGVNPAAGEYIVGVLDPSDAAGDGQNPTVGPTPFLTGSWERQSNAPLGSVQAAGLAYLGANAEGGSQVSNANSRQRRNLSSPWTSATTGTFYIGYQVNFGRGNYLDGIQGEDMGYRSTEFYTDTGGFLMGVAYNSFGTRIGPAQQNPQTGRMFADFSGAGLGGGDVIIENSPESFIADGATHQIVIKLELSDVPLSDTVTVFLDPFSSVEPPPESGPSIAGVDFTLGAINGFSFFGGLGGIGPVFDEFRVATTFIEAIPDLPIPGDTNNDHQVDMLDYNAIFSHFNRTGQPTANGDVAGANGKQGSDGRIDLRDLRLWKDHRTDIPSGAGSGAVVGPGVPEPSSWVLGLASETLAAGGAQRPRQGI